MFISQKSIPKRRKVEEEKVRSTVRLTKEEHRNLETLIHGLKQDNLRTNKNEVIRTALNEFLSYSTEKQKKLIYKTRVELYE